MHLSRREFVGVSLAAVATPAARSFAAMTLATARGLLFKISLAQWSLHRALKEGTLDHLDFAAAAKETYGIGAVEYVNSFFKDKAEDRDYLAQMKRRAADAGVTSLLIMCDGEGRLGDPDDSRRAQAVRNHYKWVEAAAQLGCHSIRVNAASEGSYEQQQRLAEEGADLNRVVIGHSGDSADIHYLCALADAGSYVGFDRFGMAHMGQDSARLRMLLDLLERGYEDRILLSQDAAVFSRMTPPSWRAAHAPDWRMDHLHSTVLPQLRAAGMDRRLQDQLMVENPRRLLAGSSDE